MIANQTADMERRDFKEQVDSMTHLERIFCSNNLIQCGQEIIAFTQQASMSGKRASLIKDYYKTLIAIGRMDAESYRHCQIFEGNEAIKRYLLLHSPARHTDIKTLKALEMFGNSLCRDFQLSQGPLVKKEQILEVLAYLEKEFGFSTKVFDQWKPCFSILGQCHARQEATWRKIQSTEGEVAYLFFCSSLKASSDAAEIIFRQMAEILFYKCSYQSEELAAMIKDALEDKYYPGLSLLPAQERSMVTANGLCLGLLGDSPFGQQLSPSFDVSKIRQCLRQLVRQILSRL